ncbi:hypothetical protein [Bacillus sp. PK3_68]|uniref:hypothetical protein n=1 Tax=Bacillus sp. PK3_68 TaxID=2027408 RepID=UPI00217E7968|nr:hypothetical protein [Bacillus sp. PK3_68]
MNLYLKKINQKYGTTKQLNEELKSFFYEYHWPGNVRELSNLLERLVLLTRDHIIGLENLPAEYKAETAEAAAQDGHIVTLREATEAAEKKVLLWAVKKYKTTYEIAEALDTSQPTIVRKLKKYKIKIEE